MLHTTPATICRLALALAVALVAGGCADDERAAPSTGSPDGGAADAAAEPADAAPVTLSDAGDDVPPGLDARVEVPDDAAAGDPGCAPSDWAPGANATIALRHDGLDRSYVVHV